MILKILGMLDILVGISFWLFGIFHFEFTSGFILISGLFLIAKGIVFISGLSIISFFDILCGITLVISGLFDLPIVFVIIISLFLIQKGIFSLVG